jgi:galactokinase
MPSGGELAVWAPGRVNVIGEHTDYSGGLVLPAAIQLGVTVRVHGISDTVSLRSQQFGMAAPFAPDGSGPLVDGWARVGQAVARELAELGRPPIGLEATIESDLPAGVGLSSSAALEIGLGLALCTIAGFDLEPLELAQACRQAEFRALGVPCGILDQAACVLGRENAAVLLNCATLEYRHVPVPHDAVLLVVDSGTPRDLETSDYAVRRNELNHAMTLVGKSTSTEVTVDDLDLVDEVSRRRLRHVMTENKRVSDLVAALSANDLESAGRLMSASHASLRDDYEVSTPALDELVVLAEREGAFGARLSGGGFGGAILALVSARAATAIATAIVDGYSGIATAIPVRASDGARVRARSVSG